MSTYVTVLKIQWYLKLAHTYLYWIHKNLYHGYKNLSVAAMKKKLYFAICIKQFRDVKSMPTLPSLVRFDYWFAPYDSPNR